VALIHKKPRAWSVVQFQRLYEQGFFESGERIELIEGEIVPMSPQNPPHARGVTWTNMVLTRLFSATHVVRVQLPIDLTPYSEPEPDFALVSLDHMLHATGHPTFADLIVEVADSSLDYDRDEKASLYARVGILDYWILNMQQRCLEVHRNPVPAPRRIYGHEYANVTVLDLDQTVTPLAQPTASVRVADLLGPEPLD